MRFRQEMLLLAVAGLMAHGLSAQEIADQPAISTPEELPPVLTRVREGGTPHDPHQSLKPFTITIPADKQAPTSGLIEAPPEYSLSRGVLFMYITGHWHQVVTDCVVALTADPLYDEIAYVVVTSSAQQATAEADFIAAGADMSKVEFFIQPANSVWLRDYGPHFIWQASALGIVDSHYYPTRPMDNFIPTLLGDDNFIMPTYDMGLYYSGGNFEPGPNRSAFVSSLVILDNPPAGGFDEEFIGELYNQFQGIDTLHIMPKLPFSVDGTGHIDMWMYLVDEDTVIISEFKPGSDQTAIDITNNAVPYMEDLGFEVFRTPAWNAVHPGHGNTHYTYTNAFRVSDRILVPTYGQGDPDYLDEDADALAAWQAAAGLNVEIVEIDCYPIIWAAGAIHCIVMQVPRYVDPTPAVHVISPDGGELLVSGTTHTISWVATDTDNEVIPQIDLYYSTDGGNIYDYIATTTDTGFYDWTVPGVETTQAKIKVVATSADTDQGEGVSTDVFQIAAASQSVHDFATGAGENKFGWGHQTYSWADVDGVRMPVSDEISTLEAGAYSKMAYSDATGTNTDPNRYRSPAPDSTYESTHIFEFRISEDPADVADIGVLWEGYAKDCTQVELYVWDYVDGQWGDGAGLHGQNRYMDSWAGEKQDGYLRKHIRSDFGRYIDDRQQMTFLVYAERRADRSFHDYMSLVVTAGGQIPGDLDHDGDVDLADLAILLSHYGMTGGATYEDGDINGDGNVDLADLSILLSHYGEG